MIALHVNDDRLQRMNREFERPVQLNCIILTDPFQSDPLLQSFTNVIYYNLASACAPTGAINDAGLLDKKTFAKSVPDQCENSQIIRFFIALGSTF